jgi:hypothetical protein
MAKTDSGWDDLEKVAPADGDDSNGSNIIGLDPGDAVVGDLLARFEGIGSYGADVLVMMVDGTPKAFRATNHVKTQLDEAGLDRGDTFGLRKQEDETPIEGDDEDSGYHHIDVRVAGGGD